MLPNGQYVAVRCDIKTKARDVFDMVVAHANLVEHFYFSLAFLDGEQSLFETRLVAAWLFEVELTQVFNFFFFLFLQMTSFSFWITKQKSPKLRPTAGKKGRYPPFLCFSESNILSTTSPSFCECTAVISVACFCNDKPSFCLINVFLLASQAQTDSPPVLFTAA